VTNDKTAMLMSLAYPHPLDFDLFGWRPSNPFILDQIGFIIAPTLEMKRRKHLASFPYGCGVFSPAKMNR
jgi:hypothetical protein